NASLCANFRKYPIERNSIALLSVLHLFQIENCSDDFSCICLFVSKTLMEEMDPTEMIYVRTKYGVRLYSSPVIKIEEKDAELLKMRVDEINRSLDNEEHYYYKQMILSSVIAFFLDMSNLIEHNLQNLAKDVGLSRYEKLTKSFIELLTTNYRQEHSVNFYAKKLNITAHYLTLIVKQITGQSVSEFIFEMLYSDSRMLLVQSKLSIQEIAALLHFSDQSSFGKFFKRRSGHSPFSYRGKTEE
ncbi:MAG: helix-turn-helix domain-containing protein, partial [Paludibacteraceae bacterium]